MSCLAIIRAARDDMSANEKRLADFILDNAPLLRDYSSQQIAAAVGVSQSSVVKFSQKLGYKGFTDLKLAIHESVVKQESGVALLHARRVGERGGSSLRERLFDCKNDAINEATVLNDDVVLQAAARAIEAAGRVQIVGGGPNVALARDFALRLASTGKPVLAEADYEAQLACARTLRNDDCLVIISTSGQAPQLQELARCAKKVRATVISLTEQAANPVATMAGIRLYSGARAGYEDLPGLQATASKQHVIDLVFFTLLQRNARGTPAAGKGSEPLDIKRST